MAESEVSMNALEFCQSHITLMTYFIETETKLEALQIKGAVKEYPDYYMYYVHIHENELICRKSRIYWNADKDVYFYLNDQKIFLKDILKYGVVV